MPDPPSWTLNYSLQDFFFIYTYIYFLVGRGRGRAGGWLGQIDYFSYREGKQSKLNYARSDNPGGLGGGNNKMLSQRKCDLNLQSKYRGRLEEKKILSPPSALYKSHSRVEYTQAWQINGLN